MASSFPDELRARAKLPGMTFEILHRPASANSPETMGIVLTGEPHLPALAFDSTGLWPTGLWPTGLWYETQRQLWAPWLALWGIALPEKR
jgi:hypothetical protein